MPYKYFKIYYEREADYIISFSCSIFTYWFCHFIEFCQSFTSVDLWSFVKQSGEVFSFALTRKCLVLPFKTFAFTHKCFAFLSPQVEETLQVWNIFMLKLI